MNKLQLSADGQIKNQLKQIKTQLTMKKFLSSVAGIKELYTYNKFIKSLPKARINKKLAEDILQWSKVYKPYDKLEQYVPGSEKYNSILKQQEEYEYAQNRLKGYNYSKETILDEHYTKYITLNKHTISYLTQAYDYDTEESHETRLEFFFYSQGNFDSKILEDLDDLLLPYDSKLSSYGDNEDDNRLGEYIHYTERISYKLSVYVMCENTKWDPQTFFAVFEQENTTFNMGGETKVDGILYYRKEVIKLMEDYKVAKDKKYIYEDRYVEYPIHKSYINFLTLLEDGTYKQIPE